MGGIAEIGAELSPEAAGRLRDRYWLARLERYGSAPRLFLCAAGRLESFRERLDGTGREVRVLEIEGA